MCSTVRISTGDPHIAAREKRRRISPWTAHAACGCKGSRGRIVEFGRTVNATTGDQDFAAIEQGGRVSPTRRGHVAGYSEFTSLRIVEFGASQDLAIPVAAGS